MGEFIVGSWGETIRKRTEKKERVPTTSYAARVDGWKATPEFQGGFSGEKAAGRLSGCAFQEGVYERQGLRYMRPKCMSQLHALHSKVKGSPQMLSLRARVILLEMASE
jgi:hypothetical protein